MLKQLYRLLFNKGALCILTIFLLLGHANKTFAQSQKPARILFLLDASGSMDHYWVGEELRFDVASRIILSIMDSIMLINPEVSFGLRAFGTQYPSQDSNCFDTKLEVPFGFQNHHQMEARLKWLKPLGFSPIALSLKKAAEEDFTQDDRFSYSIILITDGGESCGGDICATVQALVNKKISFKPYILTLADHQLIKGDYDCMGEVLTIIEEKDIPPAVHKIINDNKPVLSIRRMGTNTQIKPKATPKAPQTIVIKPVKKEPVVPTPPAQPEEKKQEPPQQTTTPVKETVTTQPSEPVKVEWVAPKGLAINKIIQKKNINKSVLLFAIPEAKARLISRKVITLPVEKEPEKPKTVVTTEPIARPSTPKTTTPTTVKPTAQKTDIKKVEFKVVKEEAEKTTLLVYFTDGNGKFYYTEPRMKIMDSKTGKDVKDVYRNISGGQPMPIEMEVGVYDIIIPGSESKVMGVTIEANKTNKVYIKAGMASLAFYYTTQPDRPAREYKAFVSNRFGQRRVVTQRCDTELVYQPENYHIEINTLPKLVYNIDLNFNQLKKVAIPTPGQFQITNTEAIGVVKLYYQMGNSYAAFLDMRVAGNPMAQTVNLLPGPYQVHYYKHPKKPYDDPVIVPFQIKSEQLTKLSLEP